MRLSLEDTYFAIAKLLADSRSTCNRAKVGALLVNRHGHIIALAYNGSESGEPHCIDVGCELENGHCVRTIHAEQNALAQAARRGDSTEGSTLYCTLEPCSRCRKLLRAAGIIDFKYAEKYLGDRA